MTFQDRDLFDHSGNDHLLTDGLLLKASAIRPRSGPKAKIMYTELELVHVRISFSN